MLLNSEVPHLTMKANQKFTQDENADQSMGNIFYVLLILVFGAALVGTIAVEVAAQEGNLTGASLTLFRLLPLIFVVIIVAAAWKFVDFGR